MRVVVPFVLLCALVVPSAHAQRRARVAPVDAALVGDASEPHQLTLSVFAREDVEVTQDLRLLSLEVRRAGSRRVLRCDRSRVRRIDPSTIVHLASGEAWRQAFDVRMFCWGRALAALDAGAELGGTLGTMRLGGARVGTERFVRITLPFTPIPAVPAPPTPPEGDVRVSLAPSDALSGAHVSLRVSVRASHPVRAWLRPDRIRFRVVAPDGTTHACAMTRAPDAPIPDLFARIGTRSGPVYSLDARAYCAESVFRSAGIYEVTPLLDLDVDGSGWRMDTPLGTFEGAPAPVRVRSGESS